MDNKFLIKDGDKANWEIPNGYPWKEIIPTVIIDNEIISFVNSSEGATDTAHSFKLVKGVTYKVVWDGQEYNCTCELLEGIFLTLGNLTASGFEGVEDTGEPFLFIESMFDRSIVSLNGAGEHTVTLIEQTPVYHTVSPNFIPIVTEENVGAIKIYKFTNSAVDVATMKEAVTAFKAGKCRIFWGEKEFLYANIDSSDNFYVMTTYSPGYRLKYKPINDSGKTFYHYEIPTYHSIGDVQCNNLQIGDYRIIVNDDGTLSTTKVTN